MERVCLVVDDKDQQHVFKSSVQDVLKKEGYNVALIFIHTTNPSVLNDKFNIDIEKLSGYIKRVANGKHIDAVATDFDLSDPINGLDVIEVIRKDRPTVPIILYSGGLKKAIKSAIGDPETKNEEDLIRDVRKLMTHNISDFIDRDVDGYAESIIRILKNKKVSTQQTLLRKLREYPDCVFRDAYPSFSGKTLGDIAAEIEKATPQGQKCQSELIEQVVAYLIDACQ